MIKPADFETAEALAVRLLASQSRYNTTARPFDWRFTRAGLDKMCRRLDARRNGGTLQLAA